MAIPGLNRGRRRQYRERNKQKEEGWREAVRTERHRFLPPLPGFIANGNGSFIYCNRPLQVASIFSWVNIAMTSQKLLTLMHLILAAKTHSNTSLGVVYTTEVAPQAVSAPAYTLTSCQHVVMTQFPCLLTWKVTVVAFNPGARGRESARVMYWRNWCQFLFHFIKLLIPAKKMMAAQIINYYLWVWDFWFEKWYVQYFWHPLVNSLKKKKEREMGWK